MQNSDGRHLSIETQNYLRQRAIQLRAEGKRVKDISAYLGVNPNTVTKWYRQYQQSGNVALCQRERGRQVGSGRTLRQSVETKVQVAIRDEYPDDYGIDSALWTRRAVQTLIEQIGQVKMPIRTVGHYLKRWGYSPQRPLKRAYEQDPKAVEHWRETVYPTIQKRAKAERAVIHWEDESGIRSNDHGGRGYAPIGHTPEIRLSQQQRVRVNYVATVTNQGTVRFMVYTSKFTGPVYIAFLERLLRTSERKLFLIADCHPVHRRKLVKQWFSEHADRIEPFFLPTYSPELNPVEYLNNDVKQQVHDKAPTRDVYQLKRRVLSSLRKLQKLPKRVSNYFRHPNIAYAAS